MCASGLFFFPPSFPTRTLSPAALNLLGALVHERRLQAPAGPAMGALLQHSIVLLGSPHWPIRNAATTALVIVCSLSPFPPTRMGLCMPSFMLLGDARATYLLRPLTALLALDCPLELLPPCSRGMCDSISRTCIGIFPGHSPSASASIQQSCQAQGCGNTRKLTPPLCVHTDIHREH